MGVDPITKHWLPPNVSTHGAAIDELISFLHVFMLVLFVGWGLYFVYCLIRFRAGAGARAARTRHFVLPTYLELGVAGIEIFVLVFMSYPIWAKVKNDFPDKNEAVNVRVVAEQFAWNFHYPGRDGKFGPTSIEDIDPADNPVGVDRESPEGKDDIITINEFHIPVDRPVIIELSSKDVLHSFALPNLRVKQDAVPGAVIPVWFEAMETGEFDIVCAQLCGIGHTTMRGRIVIDSPDGYQAWLSEQHAELEEEWEE